MGDGNGSQEWNNKRDTIAVMSRKSFGRTHAADDVVVAQPELAVRQATELVGEVLLVEAALEVDEAVLGLCAETAGKPWLGIGCGGGRGRRDQLGHVNSRAVSDRLETVIIAGA